MAFISKITLNIFRKSFIEAHFRSISSKGCVYAKSVPIRDDDEDLEKPVEFLKSEAAKITAAQVRSGSSQSAPWYQTYVISLSLSVFMVYFFILREESDIDMEFSKSLYDRISGLEEQNLNVVLEYNRNNKLPTADIERRLEEIRRSK